MAVTLKKHQQAMTIDEQIAMSREAISYDYKTSGLDYNKGTEHLVDGNHYVKCTDEEFEKWTSEKN